MSEISVKLIVGIFMVVSHFAIIITIVIFYFLGGLLFDEMTTSLGIIGPLFAGYTTVIIGFVISERYTRSTRSRRVNWPYVLLAFALPFFFAASLVTIIFARAYGIGLSDFEQFKTIVSVVEGVFGVYVGQFIYSMFSQKTK